MRCCRDCSSLLEHQPTPEEAAEFQVGQIVRNAAFTDATSWVGGMVTTHRFSILSNHFDRRRRSMARTGAIVANRDSHFKVLDIYEHEGKTQILLLHLPDDYRWKWMAWTWICRWTSWPIAGSVSPPRPTPNQFRGDKSGVAWPMRFCARTWHQRRTLPKWNPIASQMQKVKMPLSVTLPSTRLRSLCSTYRRRDRNCQAGDTGLVLGYIDEEAGVSFQPLWIVKEGETTLDMRLIPEETMYLIRQRTLMTASSVQWDGLKWIRISDRARRVIAEV